MATYTQILYHIVFGTKNRERVLAKAHREELYKYMWGVLKNHKCHLYRINGVEDHVHLLIHLHPSMSLSGIIKDMKVSSSDYIKKQGLFKNFIGWQDGYGGFTHSINEKNRLINYIKGQEEHHKIKTFREEYIELLEEHGVEFEEKYLL